MKTSPRRRILVVRLNDREHELLRRAAADEQMPVADYVRTVFRMIGGGLPRLGTSDEHIGRDLTAK
jgi:hypothetical protein